MSEQVSDAFCIEIDYKKDSENPARIFETMTALIHSFQKFDIELLKSISPNLSNSLLLQQIEIGSLRTWLTSILKGVPDEAIKNLDWKKAVGHYLLKGKYIAVKKLEEKQVFNDSKLIEDIQYELLEEASKTNVTELGAYSPIPLYRIVEHISNVNDALKPLIKEDKAVFISEVGNAIFNQALNVTTEELEDLVTKEKINSESIMILKVKRPDYLGHAMWDFKHNGHTIQVKILHTIWLEAFQQRTIDIRPGDSLRARVNIIVKYGYDYEVIGNVYELIEVIEILQSNQSTQSKMEFKS